MAVTQRAGAVGRRGPRRRRDPERSRKAILDAAEDAFAQHGYGGASLAAIAEAAAVSTALPAYFFDSKAKLYAAVVERLFRERNERLDGLGRAAVAEVDGSEDGLRRGLRVLIGGYLEFLLSRPNFVQLMTRDALALAGNGRAQAPRHSTAYEDGVRRFLAALSPPPGPAVDSGQLLVSIVAMCFFPLEHDATMVAGMGLRAWTPAFIEQRTEHVVDLLVRVLKPAAQGAIGS
jgi:TetR/AcrR family transcriptional regulator